MDETNTFATESVIDIAQFVRIGQKSPGYYSFVLLGSGNVGMRNLSLILKGCEACTGLEFFSSPPIGV